MRTTRSTGGHLPSSTRSNSMSVLFGNYLKGDDAVREWAGEVITAALQQAEMDARATQAQVLSGVDPNTCNSRQQAAADLGITEATAGELLAGDLDTVFAAAGTSTTVRSIPIDALLSVIPHVSIVRERADLSPNTSSTEGAVVLAGFGRWESLDVEEWWTRYGFTWLAGTQHIRPKFTPRNGTLAEEDGDVAGCSRCSRWAEGVI